MSLPRTSVVTTDTGFLGLWESSSARQARNSSAARLIAEEGEAARLRLRELELMRNTKIGIECVLSLHEYANQALRGREDDHELVMMVRAIEQAGRDGIGAAIRRYGNQW